MQNNQRQRLKWPTVAGLIIAIAGPEVIVAMSPRDATPNMVVQVLLQLAFCGLAVLIVIIVLRWERLPLRSIGIRRPDWSTLWTALLILIVGFLVQLLTAPLVKAWGQSGADAGIAALAVLPAWFRVVIGASGGVVEETLYRGYAVERLAAITRRRWLGATLATLIFAAAHIPTWGLGFAVVADLPAGIVLVAFYLWRRDLIANMLAHSTALIVSMFTIVPRAG